MVGENTFETLDKQELIEFKRIVNPDYWQIGVRQDPATFKKVYVLSWSIVVKKRLDEAWCRWLKYESFKNKRELQSIIYNANRKGYVDSLSSEQKQMLINHIKKINPEICLCCPCFAWKFTEYELINGCICTLGGSASENEKGQCNFD